MHLPAGRQGCSLLSVFLFFRLVAEKQPRIDFAKI